MLTNGPASRMKTCEARRKVARCEATKALNVLRSLEIAEDIKRQIAVVETLLEELRIAEADFRSKLPDDCDWETVWTETSEFECQIVVAVHDARQKALKEKLPAPRVLPHHQQQQQHLPPTSASSAVIVADRAVSAVVASSTSSSSAKSPPLSGSNGAAPMPLERRSRSKQPRTTSTSAKQPAAAQQKFSHYQNHHHQQQQPPPSYQQSSSSSAGGGGAGVAVRNYQQQIEHLVGDLLSPTAFLSHCGPSNQEFRNLLQSKRHHRSTRPAPEPPPTSSFDPISLLNRNY